MLFPDSFVSALTSGFCYSHDLLHAAQVSEQERIKDFEQER
jgi:hypothetical protein